MEGIIGRSFSPIACTRMRGKENAVAELAIRARGGGGGEAAS